MAETINLSKPLASDWHILSPKFVVQFTLRGDRLEAEWRPRKPAAHEIPKLLKKYRAARGEFLASMVEHTGTVAVLDFLA